MQSQRVAPHKPPKQTSQSLRLPMGRNETRACQCVPSGHPCCKGHKTIIPLPQACVSHKLREATAATTWPTVLAYIFVFFSKFADMRERNHGLPPNKQTLPVVWFCVHFPFWDAGRARVCVSSLSLSLCLSLCVSLSVCVCLSLSLSLPVCENGIKL